LPRASLILSILWRHFERLPAHRVVPQKHLKHKKSQVQKSDESNENIRQNHHIDLLEGNLQAMVA
jgi:hypothetical protein